MAYCEQDHLRLPTHVFAEEPNHSTYYSLEEIVKRSVNEPTDVEASASA